MPLDVSAGIFMDTCPLSVGTETSSGKTFRLRGYGMPHLKGGGAGDEFVKVQIVMPSGLSPKEKELFEELKKLRAETN